MKIALCGHPPRVGLVWKDRLIDFHLAWEYLSEKGEETRPNGSKTRTIGQSLSRFLDEGEIALNSANRVLQYLEANPSDSWTGLYEKGIMQDVSASVLRAPLTDTNPKIMCAGGNLADHAVSIAVLQGGPRPTIEEILRKKSKESVGGFYKQASSIVGTGDDIPYPRRTQRLDYEGEIALVIGKRGENIPASKYLEFTFGFALFNDFSIRDDLIGEGPRGGFNMRKNFQGCGSLGPWITSKDEIKNPDDIKIITKVNGETRQNGSTKAMIKEFGVLVEYLSSDIVLNPGDIITSGTCSGTAMDSTPRDKNGTQDPKLFLHVGDIVEVSSPQLGTISNKIISKNHIESSGG
jgi:2-keto-4-pentenoate hydratase/2-oxohepta-3-ene-1,7-dioic acid hydratase in catechol pathway